MTPENLRREARVDVRVPVVMFRGKSAVSLETSDVSFKGLFIRTSDPPPLRSLVRLKVALFDREFEAHAMAVHVTTASEATEGADHGPGVGLQFWGLAGPDRAAWDDFVRRLVHARRAAPPPASLSTAPTVPAPVEAQDATASEPSMQSGVRIVVKAPQASSKP